MRRVPLKRSASLSGPRGAPRGSTGRKAPGRPREPGEGSWKRRRTGHCKVCHRYGRLVLHHLVDENDVRAWATEEQRAEGICWDRRNALEVGAPYAWGGSCRCHDGHHHPGVSDTRIEFRLVPAAAREFAREIMGDAAIDYWRRKYREVP